MHMRSMMSRLSSFSATIPPTLLVLLALGGVLAMTNPAGADSLCKPAGPAPQSKCNKDVQCCPGLVCRSGRCQSGCYIGGALQTSGQTNVAPNNCQSCQPTLSTTAWTNVAAGTICPASAGAWR